MSIDISRLGDELSKIISSYSESVQDKALERLDNTADEILDYIKNNCPRGTSKVHLADTFIKTEKGTGVNKIIYISSSSKGRLVHLVELGYKHRSGRHVAAQPFMRPAYDKLTPEMISDIRKIISRGG